MTLNLLFYQLLTSTLVLICLLIYVWWPDPRSPASQMPLKPDKPRHKRSKESKPFTGYLHKPLCEACQHGLDSRPKTPGSPPPVMIFTHGRKRTDDRLSQSTQAAWGESRKNIRSQQVRDPFFEATKDAAGKNVAWKLLLFGISSQ